MSKTILITGANGYIGGAVARAFASARWQVFGLIRRESDCPALLQNNITPLIGSPDNLDWLKNLEHTKFDAVCSNTEDWTNFEGHLQAVVQMLRTIGEHTKASGGEKLMVLMSSGCKDYGLTPLHGDPSLAPHVETSPLNPPAALAHRTKYALQILEDNRDYFDSVVIRPTNVYGYGSSAWAMFFLLGEKSEDSGVSHLPADPRTILHGTHIDDCAEAYLALAQHPRRKEIINQAFNISNSSYDTLATVGAAIGQSYGLKIDFKPEPINRNEIFDDLLIAIVGFSQWVGSDKIRKITGWKEKRRGFVEGFEEWRKEYEKAVVEKDYGTLKTVENLSKVIEVNKQKLYAQ